MASLNTSHQALVRFIIIVAAVVIWALVAAAQPVRHPAYIPHPPHKPPVPQIQSAPPGSLQPSQPPAISREPPAAEKVNNENAQPVNPPINGLQSGACEPASVWHRFECYVREYPAFGAIIGSVITALIAVTVTLIGVPHHTRRIKRLETIMDLGNQWHTLSSHRAGINKIYRKGHRGKEFHLRDPELIVDAQFFYLQMFDMILNEFRLFKSGLVHEALMSQWMQYRWYDFNKPGTRETGGMSYRDGWDFYKGAPAPFETPFTQFLDEVHQASDVDRVIDVVRRYRPSWWRRLLAIEPSIGSSQT